MDFDFKTATPEQLRARYNDIATECARPSSSPKGTGPRTAHPAGWRTSAGLRHGLDEQRHLAHHPDRPAHHFPGQGHGLWLRQAVIDLDKVSSVSFTTRWLFGDIHIRDSSGTYQITNVWKKSIVPFTNRVQQAVDARKPANNPCRSTSCRPRYPTATRRPTRPARATRRPPPPRRTSSRLRKWLAHPAPTTRSPLPPGYPKQHTRPRLRLTRDAGKSGFSGTQR